MKSRRLSIDIYTRIGCHLCEVAERLVQARSRSFPMTVQMIDVDADPELTARFGDSVPVVVINGKIRFRGCVAPALLDRLLRMEAVSRS